MTLSSVPSCSVLSRVAVHSPYDVVARGLRSMLAEEQAVEVVEVGERPDLVLYDVESLAAGPDDDLQALLTAGVVVLALARDQRSELLTRVLDRGARGFVGLDVDADRLGRVVTTAVAGRSLTAVTARPAIADDRSEPRRSDAEAAGLTPREQEVLGLIAAGHSNQEIAERLFLSINSVKTHIRTAYRKITVTSRSQAVIWCFEHGLTPAPTTPSPAPARTDAPEPALVRPAPSRGWSGRHGRGPQFG